MEVQMSWQFTVQQLSHFELAWTRHADIICDAIPWKVQINNRNMKHKRTVYWLCAGFTRDNPLSANGVAGQGVNGPGLLDAAADLGFLGKKMSWA